MCGIAALYSYAADGPPVQQDVLAAINQAMVRRGPDGEGLWMSDDRRAGLAHKRLAIIDLSADGAQPMIMETPQGHLCISFNGEIYNFRELRRQLETDGVRFVSNSDTEVLLHLYQRDGRAMTKHLRGMFAFAIWDEQRRGMLLARDGFGIKPLYYMDDGKTIGAASQVKALLAGQKAAGRSRPQFDAAGHVGFFLFGSIPEPHTLYKDIRALPAGTTMWIDGNGVGQPEAFFDVSDALASADANAATIDLAEALRDSVRHHFVADVPVGVFLSSGLDSTTLVGLSSELQGAGLDTLTLGFEEFSGTENDEVPLAEAVAASYATRQHTVRVSGRNFANDLSDVLEAMDQPSIDGVNTYFVAKAAAGEGLKVAISGLGGDELFAGYNSFSQIPALVGGLGAIPGIGGVGRILRSLTAPLGGTIMGPKVPGLFEYCSGYGDAYLLRRGLFMPWELPTVMDGDMAREGLATLNARQRLKNCQAQVSAPKAKVAALEMAWYMRNQLLRDADWAGMAHGLEIRVPLVDVQLFSQLAGAIARGQGPDKQAMAATPKKPLPGQVLRRPKSGFFVPVRDWLGGDGVQERGLRGWAKKVYQAQIL
ncbi:MAG: asparagine synthase (glutamine-hydrolyzing) [Rhodospirillaceae bacterium]|jgi:asparagine synthase (glutamine-hydrolysing)|nr:asparagine synthase (glutamine-hydrolyzing) [Rhodospirillaceae bacterium]MBT5243103.1 asparagine synthase (glutamine-hydrolyzing) [Rhodospirillaceae bacterium]MBT5563328.1 asparagine synthase (glutamine-hydrolyzing) [Rhodospirillaceae bacterium]MBT6243642.1 asparagine synthase (glutamine-hydrolyzing) [Rhodospirillaceae bacterium]MBT7136426.1 asparagine synthase (glutamine-hydrolyzing) [Rhodospirillaceae bacterium]